ncbi:hypothetical protein QQ73_22085, partial [Candidatus Endoriftia persephone str. Guaymas]|nr:hypothetical protein [Candidatus Endoriftia persephone str. Guaymas]
GGQKKNKIPIKQLVRSGSPLLLMSSGALLLSWTDVVVLGIYETERSVGIYVAATRIALLTGLILISVNSIVAPKFSEMFNNGDIRGLARIANQSALLMTALAIPPTLIFVFFPGYVLSLFGEGFEEASLALTLLSIGQLFNVMAGSVGYMLVMTGHERLMQNIMILIA